MTTRLPLEASVRKREPGSAPRLQLGCMNFGGRTGEQDAVRIVRRALELGVSTFDTANAYNGGASEQILGRALGADRKHVLIATKVGFGRVKGRPEGLSPEVVRTSLARSLERLGTDYVDIFYLHVPDYDTPIEKTLEAVSEVLASGLARSFAVSNYASWQILEMLGVCERYELPPPVMAQQLYNALIRQLDIEYARFSAHVGLHTTVYNPLAGGLLAGGHGPGDPAPGSRFHDNAFYQRRYWQQAMFERVDALRKLAERHDLSLVDLAYGWLTSRNVVDSVLVGPSKLEHLDAAHRALSRSLDLQVLQSIESLHLAWQGTDTSYAR